MSTMDPVTTLRRSLSDKGVELTRLADGSGVLLDLSGHQVLTLNETAAFISGLLLDSETDLEGISAKLADAYEVDLKTAKEDVTELLRILTERLAQST